MTKNAIAESCPLCHHPGIPFYKDSFYKCNECYGIFHARHLLPNPKEEKERYEKHHNNVYDLKYRQFVSPITTAVSTDFSTDSLGLDFGSGTGSAVSKVLEEQSFMIKQYDPVFKNDAELFQCRYDYIVCCEVMEHFHYPEKEFNLLKTLLKPNGRLYCMTHLYSTELDFDKWYYKNDFTHVFFYQKETLEWIKTKFKFSSMEIRDRMIVFLN